MGDVETHVLKGGSAQAMTSFATVKTMTDKQTVTTVEVWEIDVKGNWSVIREGV